MKLTINAKDRDNLKEEGTLRLFLLKKEDLAQSGSSYNKRSEDLN